MTSTEPGGEDPLFEAVVIVRPGRPALYRQNGDRHTGPLDGQPLMPCVEGQLVMVRRKPQAPEDKDAPE